MKIRTRLKNAAIIETKFTIIFVIIAPIISLMIYGFPLIEP